MTQQSRTTILVTVGTTEFDQLISYVDSEAFMGLLRRAGFTNQQVLFQIGTTGKYIPKHGRYFRLHENIQSIYDSHQVIITHGGAGTLLGCLRNHYACQKRIIAVANTSLLGNHQSQLVAKLHEIKYVLGYESVKQMCESEGEVEALLTKKGEMESELKQRPKGQSVLNSIVFANQQ